MTKAAQLLARARAGRKAHAAEVVAPAPVAQPVAERATDPFEISSIMPLPQPRATIYKELMTKHDRMGHRHT